MTSTSGWGGWFSVWRPWPLGAAARPLSISRLGSLGKRLPEFLWSESSFCPDVTWQCVCFGSCLLVFIKAQALSGPVFVKVQAGPVMCHVFSLVGVDDSSYVDADFELKLQLPLQGWEANACRSVSHPGYVPLATSLPWPFGPAVQLGNFKYVVPPGCKGLALGMRKWKGGNPSIFLLMSPCPNFMIIAVIVRRMWEYLFLYCVVLVLLYYYCVVVYLVGVCMTLGRVSLSTSCSLSRLSVTGSCTWEFWRCRELPCPQQFPTLVVPVYLTTTACTIGLGSVAHSATGGCLVGHSLPCSD